MKRFALFIVLLSVPAMTQAQSIIDCLPAPRLEPQKVGEMLLDETSLGVDDWMVAGNRLFAITYPYCHQMGCYPPEYLVYSLSNPIEPEFRWFWPGYKKMIANRGVLWCYRSIPQIGQNTIKVIPIRASGEDEYLCSYELSSKLLDVFMVGTRLYLLYPTEENNLEIWQTADPCNAVSKGTFDFEYPTKSKVTKTASFGKKLALWVDGGGLCLYDTSTGPWPFGRLIKQIDLDLNPYDVMVADQSGCYILVIGTDSDRLVKISWDGQQSDRKLRQRFRDLETANGKLFLCGKDVRIWVLPTHLHRWNTLAFVEGTGYYLQIGIYQDKYAYIGSRGSSEDPTFMEIYDLTPN